MLSNDKKNTLIIEGQIETIKVLVSQAIENEEVIFSKGKSHILQPIILLLFTQNELLEVLAKEIFKQQLFWQQVQEKRLEDCNKMERIFKQMPHAPTCSDMAKGLLDNFEMRSQRSPGHSIAYKTCLAKLESMVKTHWDEWRLKQPNSSF